MEIRIHGFTGALAGKKERIRKKICAYLKKEGFIRNLTISFLPQMDDRIHMSSEELAGDFVEVFPLGSDQYQEEIVIKSLLCLLEKKGDAVEIVFFPPIRAYHATK